MYEEQIRYMAVPATTRVGTFLVPFQGYPQLELHEEISDVLVTDASSVTGENAWMEAFVQADPLEPTPWSVAKVRYREGGFSVEVISIEESNLDHQFGPDIVPLRGLVATILAAKAGKEAEKFALYADDAFNMWGTSGWKAAQNAAEEALRMAVLEHQWTDLINGTIGHELVPLAARHLAKEGRQWDDAAYDLLTGPYRKHFGPLHPGDEPYSS